MTEEPTRFLPELRALADRSKQRARRRRRRELALALTVGLVAAVAVMFGAIVASAAR